jgi:small conductance mechanosensitive channel
MILREFDYDIGPAITGFGVIGVALGFGAQTLIRDLIAGFFMIAEDQVRVGDSAVVNGPGRARRRGQPPHARAAR